MPKSGFGVERMKKFCFVLLLCMLVGSLSISAVAAPYWVSGEDVGNTTGILSITNPEALNVTVFDSFYVLSGYAAPWANVSIYRMNDLGSYEQLVGDIWVGATGMFFQQIHLNEGKNMLIIRTEMGDGRYQQIRCDVTRLGQSFLDYIRNL